MKISDEQRIAIEATGPRIAVRAGAGAGKTRVLVERYLRLIIEHGADPDQILTITFTRKAAADMKKRIVERLREAGLVSQAQRAQVGPISTVHGFCERLLREYPFDAGIDPQFELLSESSARELRRECARDAIAALSSSEDVAFAIHTLGGQSEWNKTVGEVTHGLAEILDDILDGLRVAGGSPDQLLAVSDSIDSVQSRWRAYCDEVLREALGDAYQPTMLDDPRSAGRKKPTWLRDANPEREHDAARVARGLGLLVADMWQRLLLEFDRRRQLDFAELEARTCAMLEESPEPLRDKYKAILVDEAQDLNPLQHRILKAIPAETVLHVGDPQQSIYGFRGAERKHFTDYIESAHCEPLRTNWRSSAGLLRGVERVFQNIWQTEYVPMRPHEDSAGDDPFEQVIDGVEVWHVGGDSPEVVLADGVKKLVDEGEAIGNIVVLMCSGTRIDQFVSRLTQHGLKAAVINAGRNYFLRNEIRDLSSALIALSDPGDNLALLSLLRSPLVGVSLDGVFRIGLAAADAGSVLTTLRTTELSESDGRRTRGFLEWFTPLSARCDFMPAWRVLSEILSSTEGDTRFAMLPGKEVLIANARKLLSIALERRHLGPWEFGRWLADQQMLRTKVGDASSLSEESAAIKVSTMHSAKGLEWDVVVALLNFSKPRFGKISIVPERSLITLQFGGSDTLAYAAACTQKAARELEEERRLLYVAMTRAKRKLCIAIPHREHVTLPVWEDVKTALAPRGVPIEGVRLRAARNGDFETKEEP